MSSRHPLDVLFLTNFSDFCFRSIPAIAELADSLSVRLTLLHVFDPAHKRQEDAERQINSFFPEAARYRSCQRLVSPGPLHEAVQRYIELWPVNLVVAPAAGPMGIPHIGRRSVRAKLIEECGIPLWTIGRRADVQKLLRPVKNVACWLDFHSNQTTHLEFAIDYAVKMKANLHLLHALPPMDEGLLQIVATGSDKPLNPVQAREGIERLCADARVRPQIHVSSGEGRSTFARMVKKCDADAVFVGTHEGTLRKWMGLGPRLADSVTCPTIYIAEKPAVPVWNLEANDHSAVFTASGQKSFEQSRLSNFLRTA